MTSYVPSSIAACVTCGKTAGSRIWMRPHTPWLALDASTSKVVELGASRLLFGSLGLVASEMTSQEFCARPDALEFMASCSFLVFLDWSVVATLSGLFVPVTVFAAGHTSEVEVGKSVRVTSIHGEFPCRKMMNTLPRTLTPRKNPTTLHHVGHANRQGRHQGRSCTWQTGRSSTACHA